MGILEPVEIWLESVLRGSFALCLFCCNGKEFVNNSWVSFFSLMWTRLWCAGSLVLQVYHTVYFRKLFFTEMFIFEAVVLMNVNPAGAVDVLMWWGHLYFWLLAHPLERQQPHPLAAEHARNTPGTMLCLRRAHVTACVLQGPHIRSSAW